MRERGKRRSLLSYVLPALGFVGVLFGCGGRGRDRGADARLRRLRRARIAQKISGEPVVYRDFSKIDFGSLPTEKVDMPPGFEILTKKLEQNRPEVEDRNKFEKMVYREALKLGYDKKRISGLSIRDAIKLCVDVVASRMEWFDVDRDLDFIKKHGELLPIDRYFELGLGDCDKYPDAFTEVLELMKRDNPNLGNIYSTNDELGGLQTIPHAWSSLIFVTKKGFILSHIDVSQYDKGSILECRKGDHLSKSDFETLAGVYRWLYAHEKSYEYHERAIRDIVGIEARNLRGMLFIAYDLSDKARFDKVRDRYLELGAKKDLGKVLYYSYKFERERGNHDEAERFKGELSEKFPGSYWIKMVLAKEKEKR